MSPETMIGLPSELQVDLEEYALGYLRQGRKDWDEPHTRAVVYHAYQIAQKEGLDPLVLVTTAWLHDIGYHALFEAGQSNKYEEVMDRKKAHMVNGAKLAAAFLQRPEIQPHYTPEQVERIVHLVSIHDEIESLTDKDEIAFMEADTLGAIDISRVTPTFDKESARKYIGKDLMLRRFPRFLTRTGISTFARLLPPFEAFF